MLSSHLFFCPPCLLAVVLQWYGHVSRSSGLAKTILQGTVKGGRRRRQGVYLEVEGCERVRVCVCVRVCECVCVCFINLLSVFLVSLCFLFQPIRIYGVQINSDSESTEFFLTITQMTGGSHLKLSEFSTLSDVILAICYRTKGTGSLKVCIVCRGVFL